MEANQKQVVVYPSNGKSVVREKTVEMFILEATRVKFKVYLAIVVSAQLSVIIGFRLVLSIEK